MRVLQPKAARRLCRNYEVAEDVSVARPAKRSGAASHSKDVILVDPSRHLGTPAALAEAFVFHFTATSCSGSTPSRSFRHAQAPADVRRVDLERRHQPLRRRAMAQAIPPDCRSPIRFANANRVDLAAAQPTLSLGCVRVWLA